MVTIVLSVGTAAWPLLVAHAALAGYALIVERRPGRLPVWPVVAVMAGLGMADYGVSGDLGSALTFAACWQIDFATCAAGLLLFSRWIVPAVVVGAGTISVLVLVLLPTWGVQLPVAIVVTQTVIIVVMRLGLPRLLGAANRTDEEEAAAAQARRRVEVTRRVSARVAEESRTLHDTVINTLGAIANGGASFVDVQQVREQCARDATVLETLQSQRDAASDLRPDLRGIFSIPGLPIHRHGVDDRAISGLTRRFPPATVSGMAAAAREAIINANKHSGAGSIDVTVLADENRLRVEVRDSGVGFLNTAPEGHGLAGSVFGRGRDLGFDSEVTTSPGMGTTVTLTARPDRAAGALAPVEASPEDVEAIVMALSRRAGLLWSGGVTLVTVALTLAGGTNHYVALVPLIGIMIAVTATFALKPPRRVRWWSTLVLTAATIVVFALSAAATAFGTDGAVNWQALAPLGPFAVLLSLRPPRRMLVVAASACVAAVLTLSALVLPHSPVGAVIVAVAACVGSVFALIWSQFLRNAAALGSEGAAAQQRSFQAQLASDTAQAAQDAHRRWLNAGLDSAAALLRGIADGQEDARDPAVRARAGDEEGYLRQLLLISPGLIHLGPAIMPTLRYAHDRAIPLRLRLGSRDTSDEATAHSMSTILMRALEATTPDRPFAASVFPVHDGLQLTMVADGVDTARDPSAARTGAAGGSGRIRQITFPQTGPHRRPVEEPRFP
ncbi:hypothetical protein KNO15_15335 [Leifsonia shinshuensis]|uniref:sensor histidine kinase n=1 Tax=Leifsonia shinshuensis TaxID=150026 RepID=UPI001F513CB4|nr:hypothetical protein [Leifsonia shinshuensis]MCI0158073.1 hypothetical protein [Leifsonia shinshuensis]